MRGLLPVAAAALACIGLLVGCGGSHRAAATTQAQNPLKPEGHVYAVLVFLCSPAHCAKGATRSEESLVGERLRGEQCVKRVVFTTKAQALAKLRKEYPKLVPPVKLPSNPLPDSFTVTPVKLSCASAIASAARAAHWPGVHQVVLARRRP